MFTFAHIDPRYKDALAARIVISLSHANLPEAHFR